MIEVLRLHEAGVGVKEIARRTGFSRNTVRKYPRNPEVPRYGPRARSASKLERFKPFVLKRIHVDGVWNAERILRDLRSMGYDGGLTILKDFMRPLRPPKTPNVVVRYEVSSERQVHVVRRHPGLRGWGLLGGSS